MTARTDATQRFSDRVGAYRASRPGYPQDLYDRLLAEVGATEPEIAELGSGTGIFSEELIRRGHRVFGVEPNDEMRIEAERLFAGSNSWVSLGERAERTGLESDSIDLVVSAQAFHWFDFDKTRAEVERILRPRGLVAWVWNSRHTTGSPFAKAYEEFLERWSVDYREIRDTYRVRDRLGDFFPGRDLERAVFANFQTLDHASFRARVLSASYIPAPEHPRHARMLAALAALFTTHETDGFVRLDFDAELFWQQGP